MQDNNNATHVQQITPHQKIAKMNKKLIDTKQRGMAFAWVI